MVSQSREIEKRMEKQLIPQIIVNNIDEIQRVATAWGEYFLSPEYRPPSRALYTPIAEANAEDCDRVRLTYRAEAEGFTLVVTQTIGMFCVQVIQAGPESRVPSSLGEVQSLARRMFREAGGLVLVQTAEESDATTGGAKPNDQSPPWASSLRWRRTGGYVAFWQFKDDGHPRMASIGPSLEANQHWFSDQPPAK